MSASLFGIASADVTPPVGLELCGFAPRKSTSVGHTLRAEALACEAGGRGWVLLTSDFLAVSHMLIEDVRKAVCARTDLTPESIMLSATHTHSGPQVYAYGWGAKPEEEEYFRKLCDTLVKLTITAWEKRCPGELVHARTEAPMLGSNRRVQKEDGTWTNEWRDPEGTHTGYFDPDIELIGVRRDNGKLEGLLVTYGCHPVTYGPGSLRISGDYPSYLKDALEASDEIDTALFAVSGHANVDPRVCCQEETEPVKKLGEDLAAIVMKTLPDLKPLKAGPAAATNEPWDITLSWKLEGHFPDFFPVHEAGETYHTEVQGLAVGELALLGMPGETVSEYMEKFRNLSPFAHTLILSVTNDFVGYLPTDRILEEGAYEAKMSPCRPMEEALTGKVTTILSRLAESKG